MQPDNKKSLINIKIEQSKIQEKAEEFRQLILTSSLNQDRILKLDGALDSLIYNISIAYDDQITKGMTVVGNI